MPITNLEESVIADNLKTVAAKPSIAAAMHTDGQARIQELILTNAVESAAIRSQIINNQLAQVFTMSNAATAAAVKNMLEVDPLEAKGVQSVMENLADRAMQATLSVAAGQEAVKAAQTTPPETGVGILMEAIRAAVASEFARLRGPGGGGGTGGV